MDIGEGILTNNRRLVTKNMWFNGTVKYTLLGDKIQKSAGPTAINHFEGRPGDGKSLIAKPQMDGMVEIVLTEDITPPCETAWAFKISAEARASATSTVDPNCH